MTPAVKTGYAPVNGLSLYYEIHGTGERLILSHGGVVGIAMFGPNLAALSEKRQVIAVELQGHGSTADIDQPLRFEAMADDIYNCAMATRFRMVLVTKTESLKAPGSTGAARRSRTRR